MTAVGKTTRLDAINRILSAIGEQPVNTLVGDVPPEVAVASQILDEVDLEGQSRGWSFNTEDEITLVRDVDNKIAVPANVTRIHVDRFRYPSLDITARDDGGVYRLYDKVGHTFVLSSDVVAQLIYQFDFERTPESYRRYVVTKAARVMQDRTVGSGPHHQYTEQDERRALQFLKQHEDTVDERSIFDSYAAFRVIDRQYPFIRRGL